MNAVADGYRVDGHDGRIGSVTAVLPRALLVHTGLLSCKLVAIPFDEIEEVDPARRRVVLRDGCGDGSVSRA